MAVVNVGVDGGQSQLRLRVAGRPGTAVVEGVAHLEGDTVAATAAAVVQGWQAAVAADATLVDARIGRLVLGLTTLPSALDDRLRLGALVGGMLPVDEIVLTGDAVVAHAGALPGLDGVVLVVGTGIACLGVDGASGRSVRVDGDGFLLGDRGGSFWIGSRGLGAVLEEADGRGAPTALSALAHERFGRHANLAAHLHTMPRAVNEIAQFAPVVQHAAAAGDAVSVAIISRAASELTRTVVAAAAISSTWPVPVAITGRAVTSAGSLRIAVEKALERQEGLVLVTAASSPLDGACRLADTGVPHAYDPYLAEWTPTAERTTAR